jgi:ubiquinone/menaquinone biosynthesis C-methylase UbiE
MIDAFTLMYERLADFFVENVDFKRVSNIIEVGCGKGRLAMPLVERVNRFKKHFKLVAFDMSVGPYKDHLNFLENKMMRQRLGRTVAVVRGDVTDMRNVENENVDLIVSNELLCDLNRAGLE